MKEFVKNCTNCFYAKWFGDKLHGNSHSIQRGECTIEVILPLSYMSMMSELPKKNSINKYTCQISSDRILECQCWKAVEEKNIGKKCYKPSGKPFLSGLKVNTIKGIVMHPVLSRPAYIFEEDDSYVECGKCEISIENS